MKNKKLIAVLSAAAITLSVGLTAFTACGDGCEHVYNKKETLIPATCMSAGKEKLSCVFCDDSYEQEIPVNPDAHGYDEWDITKPTEEAAGTATNVCSYNSEHVRTVPLPKITSEGTGYTSSEITVQPTALKAGERTFVLEDTAGNIVFKIPVPARGIQTVADAVEVAVNGVKQVRRSYGKVSDNKNKEGFTFECFYEFGDNYTHIIDNADGYECWYSYDEKEQLFGIRRNGVNYTFADGKPVSTTSGDKPKQADGFDLDARFIKGVRTTFLYGKSGTQEYFGAEDCLSQMYNWMLASVNGDAYEEIVKNEESGETVYKFGFGNFSSQYYCEFKIEFTITETFALKHLLVESWDYDNTYTENYVQDPETKYYHLLDGAKVSAIELIEFTNTTEAELPPEEAAQKPVNPYPADALLLKSMDVVVSSTGKVADDETVITINADNFGDFVRFENIENVGPDINDVTYDPVSVYRRTENGDVPLDYSYSSTGIAVIINNNTSVKLRSRIAGDLIIVLKSKSGNFEKAIKVHVNPVAPSKITPSYHKYGNTGYTWQQTTSNSISATVYVNQPLPFKADVSNDELSYVSTAFDARITTSNSSNASLVWTSEEHEVMEFKASAVGTYTIKLTSALNSARTCTVNVTVIAPPQSGVLFGNTTYTGNLRYPSRGPVTVTCDATAGTITVERNGGAALGGETEILHIDSYNASTGELVTSHYAGAELNFKVTVNEAYDLVLSHPTGFGANQEEIILIKK